MSRSKNITKRATVTWQVERPMFGGKIVREADALEVMK